LPSTTPSHPCLCRGMQRDVPCRDGALCTRPGCWFQHPPGHEPVAATPSPCRFGAACLRPGCWFAHPDTRPSLAEAPEERICVWFQNGRCHNGADCKFKHVKQEFVPEERVCVWFQKGRCQNGADCKFKHVRQERDANVVVVRDLPKRRDPDGLAEELRQHFRQCGYICRVQVKADLDKKCRGFAFIIFADTAQAAAAVRLGHPTWDVRRKTDLPMYIEGETRPSRKTSALACAPISAPLRFPFASADRVLLVGEGNFSYALAAVASGRLQPALATATSNEQPRTRSHLDKLKDAGVDCRCDVDATRLALLGRFDVVVFNHPHTGEPSVEANRSLLEGFFGSAAEVLRPGGRAAVTVKQTWPYSDWDLEGCASGLGFHLAEAFPFPVAALQELGYEHATTDNIPHQVDALNTAKTFLFTAKGHGLS